jgi:antitoxin VapB
MTQPRRKQPSITIRSAKAAELLNVLTKDGRSQAEVIEEALERMPRPEPTEEDIAAWQAELEEIIDRIAAKPRRFQSMKEFDAHEYDERGLPR